MLTVQAVAERLGVKEATIRVWITKGRIAHVKLGRAVRVPAEEVTRLIQENLRHATSARR
jgi:excisionase family DNA binding protein